MTTRTDTPLPPAGLLRRFGAGIYDALLVIALLMMLSVPVVVVLENRVATGTLLYQLYVAAIAVSYYVVCWRRGQTLGMRAWRLRVENSEGGPVSWQQALLRLAAAIPSVGFAGAGVLWVLVDADSQTWADKAAGTRVVTYPKEPR